MARKSWCVVETDSMRLGRGRISSSVSLLQSEQTPHPSALGSLPPQVPSSGALSQGWLSRGGAGLPVFLVEHGCQCGLPLPCRGEGAISPTAKIPLLPFRGARGFGGSASPCPSSRTLVGGQYFGAELSVSEERNWWIGSPW